MDKKLPEIIRSHSVEVILGKHNPVSVSAQTLIQSGFYSGEFRGPEVVSDDHWEFQIYEEYSPAPHLSFQSQPLFGLIPEDSPG